MALSKQEKAAQAALKEEYLAILARDVWPNDPGMIAYCRKEIAYIVRLDGGGMVAIGKPRIETNFCFGYQLSRYDTEDYDRANAMASHAARDESYFIDKNMQPIEEMMEDLKQPGIYSRNKYCGTLPYFPIRALEWPDHRRPVPPGAQPITENDRAALRKGWEAVRESFRRRLDTYLKRYGLSKIHSWSYWMDA